MSDVVEHGLLIELSRFLVYDDRCINKICFPIRSPFHIQSDVPIHPARHPVRNVLQQGSHGDTGKIFREKSYQIRYTSIIFSLYLSPLNQLPNRTPLLGAEGMYPAHASEPSMNFSGKSSWVWFRLSDVTIKSVYLKIYRPIYSRWLYTICIYKPMALVKGHLYC